MSKLFGILASVFDELRLLYDSLSEKILFELKALEGIESVIVYTFIAIIVLVIFYAFIILFRLYFNSCIKNLQHIRTEYQININRFEGKRCNLFYEILLFEKMVILDDQVERVHVKYDQKFETKTESKKQKVTKDDKEILYNRMLVATVAIAVVLTSLLFTKYQDFDIIFESYFNLKYPGYAIFRNIGSLVFVFAFIVSSVTTFIVWIYFYGKDNWKKSIDIDWIKKSYEIIFMIPVFIAISVVIIRFIISPATVTKASMEPNYYEGDHVFVIHQNNFERFDVVVVLAHESKYYPEYGYTSRNQYYIKRIIGLPGDTITIMEGNIYLNNDLLDESMYLESNINTYCMTEGSFSVSETCTFIVPENEYFVLGDNRNMSIDSRSEGTYSFEKLYGKILFKIG